MTDVYAPQTLQPSIHSLKRAN